MTSRSKTKREVALAEAEFFRSLPPERLEQVRLQVRERGYARRKVLFQEGEPAEFLWAVRRGEVRIVKTTAEGRVMTLENVQPGEIFGAMAALEGSSYPNTAETTTECSVWRLSRVSLLALVRSDPSLSRELLAIIGRRLRIAHARLLSVAYDPAEARLAQALLRAVRDGEAHVTRRELAEAAGTTVETAIRVLRRLEREGVLAGDVNRLAILDEERLRRVAGRDVGAD